jgi:uncharacterized lipoprotein YmbA
VKRKFPPAPRFTRLLGAGLLAAGLCAATGCGTTRPARFFLLSAEPATPAPARPGPAWTVHAVRLPRYLDRSQMVLRQNPHEVVLDEFNRWAEPLDAGIARVLQAAQPPESEADWQVDVEVILFDVDAGGTARLDARWSARPAGRGERQSGEAHLSRKGPGSTPEHQAASLSALLLEFGHSITETLQKGAASSP